MLDSNYTLEDFTVILSVNDKNKEFAVIDGSPRSALKQARNQAEKEHPEASIKFIDMKRGIHNER